MKILRFTLEDSSIREVFDFTVQNDCRWIVEFDRPCVTSTLCRPDRMGFTYNDFVSVSLRKDIQDKMTGRFCIYNNFDSFVDLIVYDEDAMLIRLSYKGQVLVLNM